MVLRKVTMMCGIGRNKQNQKSEVRSQKIKLLHPETGTQVARAWFSRGKAHRKSRRTRRGFTLVEILVAVSILSMGIVAIFQTFFVNIDLLSHYKDYLNVMPWVDEKIWEAQNQLTRYGSLGPQMRTSGTLIVGVDKYPWNLNYKLKERKKLLFQVSFYISRERQNQTREFHIERTAYAYYQESPEF